MKEIVSWAPGRINIIGEHTDYNQGLVLPAAINRGTRFKIASNHSAQRVTVKATNINEQVSFDIGNAINLPTWARYIYGVIMELLKYDCEIKGFDAEFSGDVPIGGGLSSSASLECSFAVGLNELWSLNLNDWQIIKACQMAEHNYVGIKCGIMDQFASVMGKAGQVVKLDCRDHSYHYMPCDLVEYKIVLLNTNVSHELADSAYNERRSECEEAVHILSKEYDAINSLRDASKEMLVSQKPNLRDEVYRRAQHVITENMRVEEACRALKFGDINRLGALLYDSHDSLKKDYEVSCKELDFLVDLAKKDKNVLGARMMGGGFGGCTINIVKVEAVEEFIDTSNAAYKTKYATDITPYDLSICDGAQIL